MILNIKAKYNDTPEYKPERPSNELDIMNDWLSEQNRKKHVSKEELIHERNIADPVNDGGYSETEFRELIRMGISLFDNEEFKEAAECFGRALKINPNHKTALKYLLKSFYFVRINNK